MKKMIIVDNCNLKDQLVIPTDLDYEVEFVDVTENIANALHTRDTENILHSVLDDIPGKGIDIENSYIVLFMKEPLEMYIIENCTECKIHKINFTDFVNLFLNTLKSFTELIKSKLEEGELINGFKKYDIRRIN